MKAFLQNYIPILGKGTAALTLAVMVDLLAKMGIGTVEINAVLTTVLATRKKP